ncbi:MAG: serine hydrolase [Myxococcales bacterium]|nr:serine hydrolase [Myxococcales bacterium]
MRRAPRAATVLIGGITAALAACGGPPPPARPAARAPQAHVAAPEAAPQAPTLEDGLVAQLLQTKPELSRVAAEPQRYRLQVLFAEVVKDGRKQRLVRHGFRVDAEYFYPASAIKPAVAVAALESLHELARRSGKKIDFNTQLRAREFPGTPLEERDPTAKDTGRLSVGHEIRKLLLASDNQSFNRLYGLVGQRAANQRLWRLGLSSVRLRHRVGLVPPNDDGRVTPANELVLDGGEVVLVPEQKSDLALEPLDLPGVLVGNVHYASSGARVDAPMSFAEKNRVSLADLQDLLIKVTRPDLAEGPLPDLDAKDRELLANALGTLPSLSRNPSYDGGSALDEIHKPLLIGIARAVPRERVFVYSKAGRAYGFTVDNAYVLDPVTKRSFFLSAVLYTNDTGVVGDDKYPYVEVAAPFFAALGEVFTRHALQLKQ